MAARIMDIPSRAALQSLTAAANEVVPTTTIGFARSVEGGRVAILYSYAYGIGGFELAEDWVADTLRPSGNDHRQLDGDELRAQGSRATERFLLDNQTERLISVRVNGLEPATRFWLGSTKREEATADSLRRLSAIANEHAAMLTPRRSIEESHARLERLEQAADLIPALLHVLDVREVIDRLSTTAKRALPHDLLLLNLFSDDLTSYTVYARSDQGAGVGVIRPNIYPASTIESWTFSVVDDLTRHPFERASSASKRGVRSFLRFPIRFNGRVIAGVSFGSLEADVFTDADVVVGQRLAEHVASAVSHFTLAQRLADEARRAEELRARTTNLELLDELLAALTDTGGVRDAFERISAIAGKVLAHDALALPVLLPDGRQARHYATSGMASLPEIIEAPDYLRDPQWTYDLVQDSSTLSEAHNKRIAGLGFKSALRVPIRVDSRNAAALVFLSKSESAFAQSDVLVARRIADRLALTLARDRELEAGKRADEATERAARLEARVRALTDELDARTGYRRVIGESPQWRQVLMQATQVAGTETTVLLLGESGTGKEVIARFLHRASSRNRGPFIALNCAALPEQLLEAELFGYERGAFTGATQSKPGQLEQAAGGTLFLDEVAEMSPSAQAKFLRVLQEREFQRLGGTRVLRTDARVVAATNRDLPKAIAQGQFREDLYYRLNVFPIRLPPLRDRRDDVLPLTDAFLTEIGRGLGRPPGGVTREARKLLLDYHWPGNVRELRNILERAAILCDGGLITPEHLAIAPTTPATSAPVVATAPIAVAAAAATSPPVQDLHGVERTMIEQALQAAKFNKSKAAKALGLTRHQLYIRMRRHGFES
jgi:transcriptional regulator with GAF, ATPase, and Fis domain